MTAWDTWETVIKAAYALPLNDDERATFNTVAGGRAPPTKQVKALTCVIGRRGGKDSVAALLATHAAVSFSPKGKLRPGEYAYVCCVACDRDQAALVFRYIKGNFETVPAFSKLIVDSSADTITLSNRVIIQVTTNSFRSVRGRSILCAIFDEVALFRSDDSANPDVELAAAVRPSLALFPNSMMILDQHRVQAQRSAVRKLQDLLRQGRRRRAGRQGLRRVSSTICFRRPK